MNIGMWNSVKPGGHLDWVCKKSTVVLTVMLMGDKVLTIVLTRVEVVLTGVAVVLIGVAVVLIGVAVVLIGAKIVLTRVK